MGQESKHGLAGSSASGSDKPETKMLVGVVVSPEAQLGEDLLPSSLRLLVEFISL